MIPQLPLALRWPRRQRFEHFHAGANAAALAAVERLAREPGTAWLYLHGPAGSGKSHLLMAACQVAGEAGRSVQYLPLAKLADRAAAIRGVAGGALLALDDLGAIAGEREAEHALFDLYNRARAEGASLLFAAGTTPAQLGLGLPDLRSRLGACTQLSLRPLDDAERRDVLKAQAALRGIELDEGVLDWLFTRHTRDLGALLDLLDRLDQASLAAQRRVTIPFLRGLLREAGA
ncbi:DnaA regulatory inactivator Hda [Rhodanobacter sp. DHB23]|uniref:DnaA regulatory inactivator Hda n=1 Tax=Rhodanobacter sp. DHB23 TaxID=2775923 RepID=UPI00177EB80C|nr:DnaA regulatory inactivator Hda [Rhodanobacter sp. DHB23]MBD8872372.1 DnaA regulatory inactivator Hda [Rhodanobacter sp. DHB23]